MKKYKKLSVKDRFGIEYQFIRLISAGADWCVNTNKDYEQYWKSPNNPYYSEAFGMLQALRVMGYGFFGACDDTNEYNLNDLRSKCEDSAIYLIGSYGPRRAYQMVMYELTDPFDCSCVDAVKGQTLTNEFIKNFYKKGKNVKTESDSSNVQD